MFTSTMANEQVVTMSMTTRPPCLQGKSRGNRKRQRHTTTSSLLMECILVGVLWTTTAPFTPCGSSSAGSCSTTTRLAVAASTTTGSFPARLPNNSANQGHSNQQRGASWWNEGTGGGASSDDDGLESSSDFEEPESVEAEAATATPEAVVAKSTARNVTQELKAPNPQLQGALKEQQALPEQKTPEQSSTQQAVEPVPDISSTDEPPLSSKTNSTPPPVAVQQEPPSQPLQTLAKLQQMLDETDYLTTGPTRTASSAHQQQRPPANSSTTTSTSSSPPATVTPPATLATSTAVKPEKPTSETLEHPIQTPSPQPEQLWTSKDRSKYKKQQLRSRQAQEQQHRKRMASPPIHQYSDTDEASDTDDGLGYSLSNLPIYFSDTEEQESDTDAEPVTLDSRRSTAPPALPVRSMQANGALPTPPESGYHYPPPPPPPGHFYPPYGQSPEQYMQQQQHAPQPHGPHQQQQQQQQQGPQQYPPYMYPSSTYQYPYAPPYGAYSQPQPQQQQQQPPPPPQHQQQQPPPNYQQQQQQYQQYAQQYAAWAAAAGHLPQHYGSAPPSTYSRTPDTRSQKPEASDRVHPNPMNRMPNMQSKGRPAVAAAMTKASPSVLVPPSFPVLQKPLVNAVQPAVFPESNSQTHSLTATRLSFMSIQKAGIMLVTTALACYSGVSPRTLPLDEYNLAFYENLRIVSLAAIAPMVNMLSVFDARYNDVNAVLNTFAVAFFVGYAFTLVAEIVITTLVRLAVFYWSEPNVFQLVPTVPVLILPWVLRDNQYRPKRITLFAADFGTTCVACPIIEEYIKLKLLQWTTKLPRNFNWVKKAPSSKRKNKRRLVAEPVVRARDEPDVVNANQYVTHMLAVSLGVKLFDAMRRILVYTKANHPDKSFYAACRGLFPIQELCGTMTALALAKRDLLGVDTPLWKLLAPAVVIHALATFRGMKPIFKWNSATPWSEMQLLPLHEADSFTFAQLLTKGFAKVMWAVIIGRVLGYCVKNYYMVNRQAVKRTTTYAGNHAAFSAELATAEMLKKN